MNRHFKRFLTYALPYRAKGILSIAFNILYALFTALSMITLLPMLKVIFGETSYLKTKPVYPGLSHISTDYLENYLNYLVTQNTLDNKPEETLTYMVILVVSTFFLKNMFGYLGNVYMAHLKNAVLKDLRNEIYTKIISLPVSFYSEKRKGDTISRATADLAVINNTYLDLVIIYIREPLNIIFTLLAMFKMSWELSLFVFTFIPISGYIISIITKKIKDQSSQIFNESGNVLGNIEETLTGLKIIKAFNAEEYFKTKFQQLGTNIEHISNKMSNRAGLTSPMSEFLGITTIACLLWFGGRMVLVDKTLVASTFITFMGLAYNILTPAKAISKASNKIKAGNAASERFTEILDAENSLADSENPKKIHTFEQEIRFDNISFKYDKEYVLKNFSLTLPKGKTVALVGQSGSGKSTLSNLITRFWDVQEGAILLDGTNIKEIETAALRAQMGIVAQDALLFNDSIRNNIALSNKDASLEDIQAAAKIANAHDFISALPKGYDNPIGDSGNMLSGGQRQRISIARAVLKNPPIMILDEATSALDTESEKSVQDALEKMMKNRTSLVIAHRLSTIQNADLIVVLRKGEIVEQGTHVELIDKQGEYYKLVNMQSLES
ncbi:MAG: ABC transporter ATP-binding protein [Flavicella sp.]